MAFDDDPVDYYQSDLYRNRPNHEAISLPFVYSLSEWRIEKIRHASKKQ